MTDFIKRFFSTDGFMPHGMCYEWNPAAIWLHVISDSVIGLAYYSIPLTLIYFVRKRKDLQFGGIFICFAAFILACGTTHWMEVLNVWHPIYWVSGTIKAITAAISIVTAILLVRLVPTALALPSPNAMREANQELAASQSRLAAVLDGATQVSIIATDTEGAITVFNSGAEKMLGYAAGEMIGKNPTAIHLESEVAARGEELTREIGKPVHGFDVFVAKARAGWHDESEWTYVRKDGQHLNVNLVVTASRDARGTIVGFVGVAMDITARKQADIALKTSAQRVNLATQALGAGIWEWDVRTNLLSWDSKMYELYGLPANAPMDYQTWSKTVAPEDLPRAEAALQDVIAAKSREGSSEFRVMLPDASIRHIQAAQGTVLDDAGEVSRVVGVNIDVTERKKLEQQFLRAQRMESIGTLAGGIAHDLNNILAPVIMSIDLLKGMSDKPDATSILETIEVSAKRGADIVRQVLGFARGMEGERIEIQPNHLVKELEKLIKDTFPKNIRLQFSIPKETWTLLGDPTQVHQVLLNLVLNARDAMPHGGTLAVSVENCVLDEQYAAMNLEAKAGPYVRINVTDTGTGMAAHIKEKIFEPFFTTKELSKGTGLGLSTVMAIIKSHEGVINVYSEPGKGSAFHVYLPALGISSPLNPEPAEQAALPRGNGETILVIDDEGPVRMITAQTLQTYGYRVLTASDGAEGVATYAQRQHEIAVVLTDMNMPVMTGRATIRALLRINPSAKIIAESGLDLSGASEMEDYKVKHLLKKPFTTGALLEAVLAILSEG